MGHGHHHGPSLTGRRLVFSIAITLVFVVGEALAGYFSHSLALVSDAGHNFADALALVFSWCGLWVASRPSTSTKTYGYHRVGILAALVNAVSLVVIAIMIFWEALARLQRPEPVQGTIMIVVAAVAVLMNAVISISLHQAAKSDLNVRAAYIHMLGDAVSAAGVVVAGVIVSVTGATIADPIVSILIGVLIVWSSWDILKEAVNILLESIPEGMDMQAVQRAICGVRGVEAVHDLHVWAIGSGIVACSCHILVGEQSIREGQNILRAVNEELSHHFGIAHTTVQVEVEGCDPDDMYCAMKLLAAERKHQHQHKH